MPSPQPAPPSRATRHPPAAVVHPLFIADWRRVVFIHFALPAAELAAHVPQPLDTVGGRAFVSLVSFSLERMRPGGAVEPRLGRALLRPISEHGFINLRTYVRGPAGPGIHFIAEWINNPLSLRLGPVTYGLPYRFAHIERADLPAGGLTQIRATEPGRQGALGITVPFDPAASCAAFEDGSLDAFLVERYTAYTHRRGKDRFFHIDHSPWALRRVDLVRTDTSLVEHLYPWFRHAELVSAHVGPGVPDVAIGRPHRCRETARTAAAPAAATPAFPRPEAG